LIRYGPDSSSTFYGHKLLICSKARWFEAASTNGFAESDSNDITLHNDDASALESMFRYIYGLDIMFPPGVPGVVLSIELYRVADKYDCPGMMAGIPATLVRLLDSALTIMANLSHSDGVKALSQIATTVYGYEASRPESKRSPIAMAFQDTVLRNKESDLLLRGLFHDVVCEVVKNIPEFGAHLLLGVMNPREGLARGTGTSFACLTTKHHCTECGDDFLVPVEGGAQGCCWGCGMYEDDWDVHRIR
jgi:hypothetical protein